ncbi:MAG: hypothetical protein RIR97_1176, partial [Pseudomonadota bacterium]
MDPIFDPERVRANRLRALKQGDEKAAFLLDIAA